ncbi:unnamed protein product [Acanthosepion pharaonis]|uniref:Uncharacterized protein n=1 Tax=Acanthosepion pharaonis TaxID=158019 RepID=A0A812D4C6_ACAPH|nr:unnamed protein product [Sepia pharaonis]
MPTTSFPDRRAADRKCRGGKLSPIVAGRTGSGERCDGGAAHLADPIYHGGVIRAARRPCRHDARGRCDARPHRHDARHARRHARQRPDPARRRYEQLQPARRGRTPHPFTRTDRQVLNAPASPPRAGRVPCPKARSASHDGQRHTASHPRRYRAKSHPSLGQAFSTIRPPRP